MIKLQILSTVVLILLLAGNSSALPESETKTTTGQNQEWILQSLNDHISSVTRGPGVVILNSDGEYGVGSWGSSWIKEFSLRAGDRFQAQPDRHASREFTVIKIEDDGVVLRYRDSFDHRSFGKNLMTIDTGEVKIRYRGKGIK